MLQQNKNSYKSQNNGQDKNAHGIVAHTTVAKPVNDMDEPLLRQRVDDPTACKWDTNVMFKLVPG
jgi:hypothetical protein